MAKPSCHHAAAGGVGLVACQWAKALGVTMIGTVSTDEKAEVARAHGCAHTIVTSREDIAKRVREITSGKGVPVVYDSVGKDTLMASLDSLQPRGALVSNGTSSGPVVIDTTLLAVKGSIWVTRPAMIHYATPRAHMLDMAKELFDLVLAGKIRANRTRPMHWLTPPWRTRRWSRARPLVPRYWFHNMHIDPNAPKRDTYLHGKGPAWFAFFMTMALMMFDYIDRQVIVSLFPHIKAAWVCPTNNWAHWSPWCRSRWRWAPCPLPCWQTVPVASKAL